MLNETSRMLYRLPVALLAATITIGLASCGADDPAAAGQAGDTEQVSESEPSTAGEGQEVAEGLGADDESATDAASDGVKEHDPADSSKWEQSPEAESRDGPENEAILTVDGKEFTFTLDWCFKNDEDLVAGGPGVAADGTKAFLDIDLYGGMRDPDGEVSVEVGSDVKFESADQSYGFGTFLSTQYEFLEHAAGWFEFTGDARDQAGENVGEATVHFSCH